MHRKARGIIPGSGDSCIVPANSRLESWGVPNRAAHSRGNPTPFDAGNLTVGQDTVAATLAAALITASGRAHSVVEAVALFRDVKKVLNARGGELDDVSKQTLASPHK